MEKITITINTVNAAFEDQSELSRILHKLADQLENEENPTKLMDINGNSVGTVEYE